MKLLSYTLKELLGDPYFITDQSYYEISGIWVFKPQNLKLFIFIGPIKAPNIKWLKFRFYSDYSTFLKRPMQHLKLASKSLNPLALYMKYYLILAECHLVEKSLVFSMFNCLRTDSGTFIASTSSTRTISMVCTLIYQRDFHHGRFYGQIITNFKQKWYLYQTNFKR